METTTENHPFCSAQLKEMVDKLEGLRVQNLSYYHEAASNTEGARHNLMSHIRDDEKRRLMLCQHRYEIMVESGIDFLQEMRRCEKLGLDVYVDTEEKAIAARRMQCDKEMEERGGSSEEKMKGMKWVPPPDCRCF
jgi:uridine kinase